MPETRPPLKVFLCHASQDKLVVRELSQRLLSAGWIDPWLDEKNLLLGQDWRLKIEEAVETSDVVIICLSTNSVSKEGYVQKELRYVREIALEKPEGTIFLIPLRLDSCETPRGLRFFQWGDYFGVNKESTYNSLLLSLAERHQQIEAKKDTYKEKDREIDPKALESRAIRDELLGDYWNALKIWYEIKRIDPLFPRVDVKISELEGELRTQREAAIEAAKTYHGYSPRQLVRIVSLMAIVIAGILFRPAIAEWLTPAPTITETASELPTGTGLVVISSAVPLTETGTPSPTTNPSTQISLVQSFAAPGSGAQGITWDGTSLWLSDISGTIFKVDVSGKVLDSFAAPDVTPMGLTWDGTSFWLYTTNQFFIYQFQVGEGGAETISSFSAPIEVFGGGITQDLTWDGESLWYANQFKVYKLDISGEILNSFTFHQNVAGLEWDGSNLWIAYNDFPGNAILSRVDTTGEILGTYPSPIFEIDSLAWEDGYLWAVGLDALGGKPMIYKIDIERALVPAGEFIVGDGSSRASVFVDAFRIDKTEITRGDFVKFLNELGQHKLACDGHDCLDLENQNLPIESQILLTDGVYKVEDGKYVDYPVTNVTWYGAAAFCESVGGRLPTETEWEKAARGTDGRMYPWGNEFYASQPALNYCDINCPPDYRDVNVDDGHRLPAPVGSYPIGASPYGALDMLGNVSEWVSDIDSQYYSATPVPLSETTGDETHIIRGGFWRSGMQGLTVTLRAAAPATYTSQVGFRCVYDP